MVFPEVDRVKYAHNPLAEVVIQLTFSQVLGAESGFSPDGLSKFHQSLSAQFPFFTPEDQTTLSVELAQQSLRHDRKTIYNLISHDGKKKILFSDEWIAFTTTTYESWESFKSEFEAILNACQSSFKEAQKFKRVGLRYRDVIERSKFNLPDQDWCDLLSEKIAPALLGRDAIHKNLSGFQSNFLVDLDRGAMVANLGLITNAVTQEQAFLIDGDFYSEEEMDYAAAISASDYFNLEARNFFRWCIKPSLHQSLEPTLYRK